MNVIQILSVNKSDLGSSYEIGSDFKIVQYGQIKLQVGASLFLEVDSKREMNAFDKLLLYWPFQKENKKTVDLFGIRYQLRRRRRFLTICRSNQVSFWWHFWLLLWEKIIGVNCPFGSGLSGKYLTLSMTTKTLKRLMIKQRSLELSRIGRVTFRHRDFAW